MHSGGATATIDLWSVHRSFFGVTLHFEKDLKLYDIILGRKSMDFERSTAVNILRKLNTLFCEFGIDNLEKVRFVTDRGTNILKALEDNIRLNCSSHLLANVLEPAFDKSLEVAELVETCKKMVRYFKKANLQHQLLTSLKNPCPTRWNSNYTMFKSIVDNWFDINEILKDKQERHRLLLVNITTLQQIVDLCSDIEEIYKKLQLCSSPSLCYVVPSINKMRHLCEPQETDVPAILGLKKKNLN